MLKDILVLEPELRAPYLAAREALDAAIYPTAQASMRHTRDLPELGPVATLLAGARNELVLILGERETFDA